MVSYNTFGLLLSLLQFPLIHMNQDFRSGLPLPTLYNMGLGTALFPSSLPVPLGEILWQGGQKSKQACY